MNSDWENSIVLINSSRRENTGFGTGFVIHQDERAAYIVTSAHVVEDIGGPEEIEVGGIPASVAAIGAADGIDLAVLRVEELLATSAFTLRVAGREGSPFISAGFQLFSKHFLIRPVQGKLGEQVGLETRKHIGRIKAWVLEIDDTYQLQPGHSGSPLVDKTSGYVIGVISYRRGEGKRGLAISVDALNEVWPEMPPEVGQQLLTKRDYDSSDLDEPAEPHLVIDYRANLKAHLLIHLEEIGHRSQDKLVAPRFSPVSSSEETVAQRIGVEALSGVRQNLAITGPAGSGKSIALVQLLLAIMERHPQRVPILVLPDDVKLMIGKRSEWTVSEVEECLFTSFRRVPLSSPMNEEDAKAALRVWLDESRLIFAIDAIDEIDLLFDSSKQSGGFSVLLSSLLLQDEDYRKSQFAVTARTNRYYSARIGPWPRYELREWQLPQLEAYFKAKPSLFAAVSGSKKLQALLSRPIMCYFMDYLGEQWLDERVSFNPLLPRYGDLIVSEPTFLYTRFIAHSLVERENLDERAVELLGSISKEVFLGRLLTRTDAIELIESEIEEARGTQEGEDVKTISEHILNSFVGSTLIYRISSENPYIRFMHESYLEYSVAYWLNRLISRFEENSISSIEGRLRPTDITFFAAVGGVKPTESIYSYLRDLSCGFLHRHHYTNLTVDSSKLIRLMSAFQSHYYEISSSIGVDRIENATTMLMQLLRGFLYNANRDNILQSQVSTHSEACKEMLTRFCAIDNIIVRSEAAVTLVGFGVRQELEELLSLMMADMVAFEQRKEHIRQIWGFDKYDRDSMDRARQIAWKIINSEQGFRPALRPLNVFQLAQFSDNEEDIDALLKLQERERSKSSESRDDFLIQMIDYSVKLIRRNEYG
jgi:hypothetical protein